MLKDKCSFYTLSCIPQRDFCLEFLRGDYVNLTMGLKSAQMTSLIVMIVGICLFIYFGYLDNKHQDVAETVPEAPQKQKKRK